MSAVGIYSKAKGRTHAVACGEAYDYSSAGRRDQISRSGTAMLETHTDEYGYNTRCELISAAKNAEGAKELEYAYRYDDIGNRITSLDLGTNRTYVANSLNQYTSISNSALFASPREEFTPHFKDDGNQTLIQTATGICNITLGDGLLEMLSRNYTLK